MAIEIKMPQLSDTMDSGKILNWSVKEGQSVERGAILAEVETDKANLQIECFHQGVVLKIVTAAGSVAKVGEIIAYIGQAGEAVGSSAASVPTAAPASSTALSVSKSPTTPSLQVANGSSSSVNESGSERIKASPLARKIAQDRNIDLGAIQGSGPNGRIVKRDIEQGASRQSASVVPLRPNVEATSTPQPAAQAAPSTRPTPAASSAPGAGRLVPMSKMRETIARRMQESVTQAPHFYVSACVDMGQAIRLRTLLKEREDFKGISLNHLVIKAAAYGLQREPRVNYAVRDGQIFQPEGINIGIITAIDDGLLIPVIRDANTLSLKDLVFEARAAVERARAGRPNATDLTGGTFSISNMGMYNVESFTAIINPGQGSILAVSSSKEEVVVRDGRPEVAPIMRVTISVDHRIIDGVMASNFLNFFKEALETPALIMI